MREPLGLPLAGVEPRLSLSSNELSVELAKCPASSKLMTPALRRQAKPSRPGPISAAQALVSPGEGHVKLAAVRRGLADLAAVNLEPVHPTKATHLTLPPGFVGRGEADRDRASRLAVRALVLD